MSSSNEELSILPNKSKKKYLEHYRRYEEFMCDNRLTDHNEAYKMYYIHLKKTKTPSSCATIMSAIKRCLEDNDIIVDQSIRTRVTSNIKKDKKSTPTTKSAILSLDNIYQFLKLEDDSLRVLSRKVILILGFYCALRVSEQHDLKRKDIIEDVANERFQVIVERSKTDQAGEGYSLYIPFFSDNINLRQLINRYLQLFDSFFSSDENRENRNLFAQVSVSGNFCNCNLGINQFSKLPSEIASTLGLQNPKSYTGHCLRRSLATSLASNNATGQELQSLCRWASTSTANHYIQRNEGLKTNAVMKVTGNRSNVMNGNMTNASNVQLRSTGDVLGRLFSNCSINNITVNIYSTNESKKTTVVNQSQ